MLSVNNVSRSILVSSEDSSSIDAFSRLRVSNPVTLFDSKQIFDNQALFWDDQEVSGGGTGSNHSSAEARSRISVSATTTGKRVRQTFSRFNYQPGKSQLILMTFVMSSQSATGVTADIGYFDDNNGIYLSVEGGTKKIVRRTKVTGSVVNNKVSQADWNLDQMDGTGPSGITLNFTKTQILVIDFEWLGVGRVRVGFVVDGLIYYAHEFLNSNSLSTVYMSTPNLPLRYSIENDGTGGATSLDHICCSVISEGGNEELGVIQYKSTEGTHLDAATENTIYAVIGIRLKAAYLGAFIKLLNIDIQEHAGSKKFEWILKLNPSVANTFSYSDKTNSACQIAIGGATNTVTGGTDFAGGFGESGGVQSGRVGTTSQGIKNLLRLGSKIDGTVDEIVLCVRPIAGSTAIDIEAAITWQELS